MEQKIENEDKIKEGNMNDQINIEYQQNNNDEESNGEFGKYKPEILNVSNEYSEYDINFKIIVIGNSGVGKTCITNQAIKGVFCDQYQATIGMEIFSLFVKLNNKIIKLQIWDTCGQEIYRSLITNFYRSSSLAIIVYSIDQRSSFEDLDLWIKELKLYNSPDTKLILVGNKKDLEEKREIAYSEGEKFVKDYGFLDFFETSAKTGENIRKMFIKVAIVLYEEHIRYKDEDESSGSFSSYNPAKPSRLSKTQVMKKGKKKKKCCM